jgi:hypothetical protein
MLVPDPAPAAGSGQKAVMAILIIAMVALGIIAWMGMRS